MGIKILRQRFRIAATPEGCRWCGADRHNHAARWVPGHKWHLYTDPTKEQIAARFRALRNTNRNFVMPGGPQEPTASPTRTQL
jgi:hypothetical protein